MAVKREKRRRVRAPSLGVLRGKLETFENEMIVLTENRNSPWPGEIVSIRPVFPAISISPNMLTLRSIFHRGIFFLSKAKMRTILTFWFWYSVQSKLRQCKKFLVTIFHYTRSILVFSVEIVGIFKLLSKS